MKKEEMIIEKFGLCSLQESTNEIRQLLKAEVESCDNSEGCGEYLRASYALCCFIWGT